MESKVVSTEGKELRTLELSEAVFGLPVNEDVIYYAINNELANARLGTASTKDRSEVHGTNRRPYSQKGTGRARHGDTKSNVYVGGGISFGPKPRDFSYMMPRKAKRLALKTILSLKAQDALRLGRLHPLEVCLSTSKLATQAVLNLKALRNLHERAVHALEHTIGKGA